MRRRSFLAGGGGIPVVIPNTEWARRVISESTIRLVNEEVDVELVSINGDDSDPYRIQNTVDSIRIRLTDENGGPFEIRSIDLEAKRRPIDYTDTVVLEHESDGVYSVSDWGYGWPQTEYLSLGISGTGLAETTGEVPIVDESDPLDAPIREWRPRSRVEQPVIVEGERYYALEMLNHTDETVGGWIIYDEADQLVTDETTREQAALTATVAVRMRERYDEAFLRKFADTLREIRQLANVSEIILNIRDTAAKMLGVLASKGAGELKEQATDELIEEVAYRYAAEFVDQLAGDRGFVDDPLGRFEGAIRNVADMELGIQAELAENGAEVASQYDSYDEWTYEDAAEYWRAVSEAIVDGTFYMTLRTNMLPDADIRSQLQDVAIAIVDGATPADIERLASLLLSDQFGYFPEAIEETAFIRERVRTIENEFAEHTAEVHDAAQDAYESGDIFDRTEVDIDDEVSATVEVVDAPSGEYVPGELVPTVVEVTNTTEMVEEFFIGYGAFTEIDGQVVFFDNQGTTGHFVELAPNESTETEVTWRVESEAPVDRTYGFGAAVWSDFPEDPDAERLDEERRSGAFSLIDDEIVTIQDISVEVPRIETNDVIVDELTLFKLTIDADSSGMFHYQFDLIIDGNILGSKPKTLKPGPRQTVTIGHVFEEPGTYEVTILEETIEITVEDLPDKLVKVEFTEVETNAPVKRGTELVVTADIQNAGDAEVSDRAIFLDVGERESVDTTTVDIGAGETVGVELTYRTDDADIGEQEIRLSGPDIEDSMTQTVEIYDTDSDLELRSIHPDPSTPSPGDTVEIGYTIANEGNIIADEVIVQVRIEDAETDETVLEETRTHDDPLDPKQVTTESFTWETEGEEPGHYTITAGILPDPEASPVRPETHTISLIEDSIEGQYDMTFDPEMRFDGIGDQISALGYELELVDIGTASPVKPYELPGGAANAENIVIEISEDGRVIAEGDPSERIVTKYLNDDGGRYGYPSQPAIYDGGDLAIYVAWSGDRFIDVEMGAPADELAVIDTETVISAGQTATVAIQFDDESLDQSVEFLGNVMTREGWEISDTALDEGREVQITPPEGVDTGSYDIWLEVDDSPGRYIFQVTVAVDESDPAQFAVEIDETNAPVEAGGPLEVTAALENTRDETTTQEILLDVGDQEGVDSEAVELENGASTTVDLSHETDDSDIGELNIRVRSEDDEDSTTVEVLESRDLEIRMEDRTGDGTDDVWLSNGRIWLQMNGEDLESRTFISALGRTGSDELAGPWQFRPRTHDGHLRFESNQPFEIVEESDEVVAYGVVREYTIDDVPFRMTYTVALTAETDATIVETRWTNLGSDTVQFDQPPGHIHDGVMLVRGIDLTEWSGEYRFHVSGTGTRSFDAVRRWQTFDIGGGPPFVTVFDDDHAVTYALLKGATGPHQAVTNGQPADRVDFMVQAVTVEPDETVTYTTAIGAHDGGDDAVAEAEALVTDADDIDISVEPPLPDSAAFIVEISDTNDPIEAGNILDVTAEIDNVGDERGAEEIILDVGDKTEVDGTSVELNPGEAETIILSHEVDESGEFDVVIRGSDDEDSTRVTVDEAIEHDVEFHSCTEVEITGDFEGVHLEASYLSGATDASNYLYGSDLLSDDGTTIIDVYDHSSDESLFYIDYVRLSEDTDIDPMSTSDEIDHTVDNPIEKSIEGCIEHDTGERPEASISFTDQTSDGKTVIIDSVSLSHGGFVTVYDGSEESMLSPPAEDWNLQHELMSRTVVGASEYLEPGSHNNVEIELDEPLDSSQDLVAIPHHDSTRTETYEFVESGGHADWLYYSRPPYNYAFISLDEQAADPEALEVEITETNDPVAAGERFELTAEVTNVGGEEVTQDVQLLVGEDRDPTDSGSVAVGPGESQTVTLGFETYPVEQDVSFPVYVVGDTEAARTVEVVADGPTGSGQLEVEVISAVDPVGAGEWFELTAEVTNAGDEEVTQDIQFLVGEDRELMDTETVTVGPGETQAIVLGYETYPVQQDVSFPVYVVTNEDEDEIIVDVVADGAPDESTEDPAAPAHLEVTIIGANDPVGGGEWLELTAQVENTGDGEVTQTVQFLVGDDREPTDSTTVTVGSGETERVTLGYHTYPVQTDVTFPVYVVTDDDEDERIVEVYAEQD